MTLWQRAWKILISNKTKPSHQILRAIEFEQEYFLAGLTILSYFGTVLRNRIPDSKAKVRIEQDNLKVTLIIETSEGQEERIERFLNDYTLAVVGEKRLEEVTQTKEQLIELRQQLRLAAAQVEFQRDMLSYKNAEIERLNRLFYKSLKSSSLKVININNSDNKTEKKAKFSFINFLSWAQNGQFLFTLSSSIIGIIVFFLYPKLFPSGLPNLVKLFQNSFVSERNIDNVEKAPENFDQITFFCDLSNDKPATVSRTSRGNMTMIIWEDEYDSVFFGKTPEERCKLTSGKFQAFHEADLLNSVKVTSIDGNNYLCAVKKVSNDCEIEDLLMPISPRYNPGEFLQGLMNWRDGAQTGPTIN